MSVHNVKWRAQDEVETSNGGRSHPKWMAYNNPPGELEYAEFSSKCARDAVVDAVNRYEELRTYAWEASIMLRRIRKIAPPKLLDEINAQLKRVPAGVFTVLRETPAQPDAAGGDWSGG